MFFSCVKASISSKHSSRPMPDCFTPPNGTPRKCLPQSSNSEIRLHVAGMDCADEAALRGWNTKYFGKQGELSQALRKVSEVPQAERKSYGQEANRIKENLQGAYDAALARVAEQFDSGSVWRQLDALYRQVSR